MANALVSWLQLTAGAPGGQAQVSWLQLSASATAGQAQVSWLQLQAAASGSLACAAGAFVIDGAPSLSLYALIAAGGALAITGRAAALASVGVAPSASRRILRVAAFDRALVVRA